MTLIAKKFLLYPIRPCDETDYEVQLIVTDEFGFPSEPDTVIASFDNVAPIADAGDNQDVLVGATVFLDGSGSSDANLDPLIFGWNIVSSPDGSLAELDNPALTAPIFTADLAGTYVISLVVNDGLVDSEPSNITVMAVSSLNALADKLGELSDAINALDDGVFKNKNMKNALTNKINATLEKVDEGLYQEALDKLTDDIQGKTDGCAATGNPDKNDWIRDCGSQGLVYPIVLEAIDLLMELI